MKILIIGVGSIGTRHASNVLALGYTDVSVVSAKDVLPVALQSCRHYKNLFSALEADNFDAAFICSPTAAHAEQLLLLLDKKVQNVYVEKPVSNNSEKWNDILKAAASYQNRIVVGYDLHFDPGMQQVQQWLKENKIGKVVSANAFVGQHLSQWRPYEDYRKGMSARTETGGGVLLDLVHEFDYLYTLFGNVNSVDAVLHNTGKLEIETEEAADVLLLFSSGISATIHLDYLQPTIKRYATITGTEGAIHWDIAARYCSLIKPGIPEEKFVYDHFERNDRFIQIIQSFLSGKQDSRLTHLSDGLKSVEMVLAAKKAATENRRVALGAA